MFGSFKKVIRAVGTKINSNLEELADSIAGDNIVATDRTVILTKDSVNTLPSTNIAFGIEWDETPQNSTALDIDASVLCLNKDRKIEEVVYYGTVKIGDRIYSQNKSIMHSGDNLTGEDGDGDADDETIFINLNKVDKKTESIVMVVNIYDAESRGQTFNTSKVMRGRVYDTQTNKIIFQGDLSLEQGDSYSLIVGEFRRQGAGWKYVHLLKDGRMTLTEIKQYVENN